MKNERKSAFVELVMKDASEEEKAEATTRWFRVLESLIRWAEEDERRRGTEQ